MTISRAEFEANLQQKLANAIFRRDVEPLLMQGTPWDCDAAAALVFSSLIARIPGEPGKSRAPDTVPVPGEA